MGVRNKNSTGYVHPDEPNLLNIHKAMTYRDGEPHVRVDLGSDSITVTGNINILDNIRVNNTDEQSIPVYLTSNPTVALDANTLSALENINATVSGTVSIGSDGTVSLSANTLSALENITVSGSVSVGNFPASQAVTGTFWQTTQPVSIASLPEIEIKNDTGNPVPISATTAVNSNSNPIYIAGNVSTIGGSAQGKLWTMQIAQGLIAGHTVEQVTGYNPSTSAGDAVWSGGTAYPWSSFTTAQTLYLKSSTNNATDRSMSILIDGLDANYVSQTEVVTLNASDSRTAVVSTKQFLRIHNIQCNGADTNVGDIITTVTSGTGTVVSKISAGRGSARAGCFTIPAGYTGYLFKGDASSTAATVVNFMARYYGKAFMVVHVAIVDNSTYIYDFPFPMPLPEKTDMYCTIEAGSGKTAVNYEILLVAN
jgi:hypothetical protein